MEADPFDPLSLNDLCNVTFGVYNEGGSGGVDPAEDICDGVPQFP